ncbi:MAG: amidohydrolase family protein [Actinobacteria bacterium]|nr:amidohydrolase family protein [Actinomycetota bacterium]
MFGHVWFHHAPGTPAHGRDAFAARAVEGQPLGEFVIDVHSHPGVGYNHYWKGGDVDDMVRTMDRTGVDYACLSAYVAIGPDFVGGNDLVAAAVRRHPTRVIGFAVPNPHYLTIALADIRRRVEDQGFRGLKIHSTNHGYPILGPHYRPIYEFADDHKLPILSHTWESAGTVAKLARTYPNVTFIWAHAIWQHVRNPDLAVTVRDLPNVVIEMAGSGNRRGQIEDFVRVAGAEHVVFGSDYPVLSQTWQLGQVAHAAISEADKRKIFSGNIRRVLGV